MSIGIVTKPKTELSIEFLKEKFPAKANTITTEVVDLINQANNDPEFNGNEFVNSMITYQSVMLKNSASISEFIKALKFCAYLEATDDNYTQAYIKARGDEQFVIDRMNKPTTSPEYKMLTNAASRYRKSPIVIDLLIQTSMPENLLFRSARLSAFNVLFTEMTTAMYSKDRITAADKLLVHTTAPETKKIELDIGNKQDNIIDKYMNMINDLVRTQKEKISAGEDLKSITNIAIIKTNDDIIEAETE